MSSIAEKPLAFDTSLYKDVPANFRKAVMTEDLAGFFLENGVINLEERINPRELKIINGRVFDPIRQEDVNKSWQSETELSAIESAGAERFYSYVLQGYPTLLISGPGGKSSYLETRVNIAHKVDNDTIHFYGIPSLFNQEDCLKLAWMINKSLGRAFNIQTIDDLRETPIPLNHKDPNLWNFIGNIAPIDSDAWNEINKGSPWIRKESAKKKAKIIIEQIEPLVSSANTSFEHIRAGAYMEISMQNQVGWKIGKRGCPGLLNSELISSMTNLFLGSQYTTDVFGNIRRIISETFDCPKCEGKIPSGKGITVCPHCGAKKEDSGVICD